MASIIDIKRRKASVESTGQITKAMKLVSTVKLQRAKQRADESKAYFNKMYETISSILAKAGNINHPYLQENGSTTDPGQRYEQRRYHDLCGRTQSDGYVKTSWV